MDTVISSIFFFHVQTVQADGKLTQPFVLTLLLLFQAILIISKDFMVYKLLPPALVIIFLYAFSVEKAPDGVGRSAFVFLNIYCTPPGPMAASSGHT